MISSKKELEFYIRADRIMNGCPANAGMKERMKRIIGGGGTVEFLRVMRTYSYYKNLACGKFSLNSLRRMYYSLRFQRLSQRLGFSIGSDCLGYGTVIPHWGTIVINGGVRIGNYAVLHTSTCIGGANKSIGNGLYLSSGSMIMGKLTLGNYVSVASNSLVNKSFGHNVLLAGTPATVKRENYLPWYERDGERFAQRVSMVEALRREYYPLTPSVS